MRALLEKLQDRLLAALALGLDATFSVRLGGLESDASLAATARERLDTMARWPWSRTGSPG